MIDQRRQFLRTGIALAAVAALPGLVGCAGTPGMGRAAPPTGTRVSEGVYRARIGNLSVTAIADGFAERPLAEGFVRNATLAQVRQALRDGNLPDDKLTIPFTAFLAESGGKRVLFDTGNGQFGAPTSGRVVENLRAAGVAPESIDAVMITHFHGDHINGLRGRDGALTFPKARVYVPAPEWNFWMDDARMAAAPEAMKGAFQTVRRVFEPLAARVERFEPGTELLPGLRSIAAYGHTPGHTAFTIESAGRTWAFVGDVTNIAALFVRNPDWAVAFDMDPEMARATRRRIFDRAIAEDWHVSGYHLPFPAIGKVERRGSGYEFTPMA
jgi:glyoxylase-like metal-dependent hydrolase (beta-lactamase superfamily II)